jgi:hypothetical protein
MCSIFLLIPSSQKSWVSPRWKKSFVSRRDVGGGDGGSVPAWDWERLMHSLQTPFSLSPEEIWLQLNLDIMRFFCSCLIIGFIFFFPHCLQSSVWPYWRRNFLHLTSVIWSLSITRPRNGRAKQRCKAASVSEVSNTLYSADYDAVMVARTAVIAPTAKVLRIEARDEELPFALRQSLSLSTEEHARPARTGNMVSI